jgi:hypothetical protein
MMCSRKIVRWFICVLLGLFVESLSVHAFLPPEDTVGPLNLSIANPGPVTVLGQSIQITVTLKNTAQTKLEGAVHLTVIDDWRIDHDVPQPFSVEANGTRSLSFNVIPGKGSYAALYPVHAWAAFRVGSTDLTAHAILITSVTASAVAGSSSTQLPTLKLPKNGRLRLDASGIFQPSVALQGVNPSTKPVGWQGTDETTGAWVQLLDVDRGQQRHALGVHPAWRQGWGDVFVDYHVALPDQTPITLDFSTAIRDNTATEPASDGVEYRVQVSDGGAFQTLYTHFSAAKRWEPAQIDLSAYAGREVTLRLVTDPGPAHNTACDQSYWAEPVLASGAPSTSKPEPETNRQARRQAALDQAKAALQGKSSDWSWKLESAAGITGAAIVPGPSGLADAFIVFVDGQHELVFDGFKIEVDDQTIGAKAADLPCQRVENHFDAGRGTLTSYVGRGDDSIAVQASIWAEKGALRIAFAMPGAQRDLRGEPRFTALGIGSTSELAHRVYAGFGNVLQDPSSFDLRAGAPFLTTRHIGLDFVNGLSMVQATDIFPDLFHVDPNQHAYALIAHNDATFSFVPSTHHAFAAAHVYHDLVDFKPAGGVANLLGRMCLDQWDGDYRLAAQNVEKTALYGVTDAVFIKHVWQRWGYDYRLPDIYPPHGNMDDFKAMVEACKRHGILFCPHDNYIDFYPDATGYSYDDILFNADGTPQKAWLNPGRDAQSYRWSPNAFGPWLETNLQQVKTGFAPSAYFVDVFSAIAPMDFYDRRGRFYPKTVTAERWGAALDRIREILGNNAPTISEAGQDGLIGHLDAGESDHSGWLPDSTDPKASCWRMPAGDAERIPWHDMASHGSFVLLAGGLGSRYAGGQDETLHGYGSDDYLSLTVLGGRNPMCDGPFSRHAVMTYWLLHDICSSLAHDEMLSDEFAEDDIHRQSVSFSNGGTVQVNRGKSDWTIGDQVLPSFGFIAKAGENEAGITRRDGIISAYAKSPGTLFVDARPNVSDGDGQVLAHVVGVDDLGNRRFCLRIEWQVLQPVSGYKPFVHFVSEKKDDQSDDILFQGGLDLDPTKLSEAGTYASMGEVTIPASLPASADIAIRFGLFQTGPDGKRLPMQVAMDPVGRARGGYLHLENNTISWQPEPLDPAVAARAERLNLSGKMIDFGPVATNGAFRLIHGEKNWQLIPLPNSAAFQVELHLNQLNASGQKVQTITVINPDGKSGEQVKFSQDGQTVHFETSADVFAYEVSFTK